MLKYFQNWFRFRWEIRIFKKLRRVHWASTGVENSVAHSLWSSKFWRFYTYKKLSPIALLPTKLFQNSFSTILTDGKTSFACPAMIGEATDVYSLYAVSLASFVHPCVHYDPSVHYDPYVHYDPCVHRCICQPGYEGRNCEVNINECADLPCRNGSTCIDLINDFRWDHRRRIKTEEKAKVVATVWGVIQFLATLAVFPKDDLKKGWLE